MSIETFAEEFITKSLEEINQGIIQFADQYKIAKEFIETFGEEKLKEYREKEPGLMKAIEKAAKNERKSVLRKLSGKGITIDMILNTHKGVELYVPANNSNGTLLERDLLLHACGAFYRHDPCPETGAIGDFYAIKGNVTMVSNFSSEINNLPEEMQLANVDINVKNWRIPVIGDYKEKKSIKVRVTPSALKYKLIPVHKKHRKFYPGYKEPFEILTKTEGSFKAQVTSKSPSGVGNYICSLRDGRLGQVMKGLRLKEDSYIQIEEIDPQRRYFMKKV